MRLDKFLSNQGIASRSQVKEYIRKGRVIVNEQVVKTSDQQIDESKDRIYFDGELILYQKNIYIMLNKPQGIVSATMDNVHKTAFDLLKIANKKDLFIVGRLDLDTEGLLLITNDGELSHNLLSPKRHVSKTYQVIVEQPITKEQIHKLEAGLDIGEEKLTLPARVQPISENEFYLSIVEGKFHQVKRMLQAVDNQVVFLKRVAIAGLKLDETLEVGEYRELTKDEYFQLTERE